MTVVDFAPARNQLKRLDEQVRYCLERYEATRNSDITLMIAVWKCFYPSRINEKLGYEAIALIDLFELPREDNIKRIRAKIQNVEHLYVPTTFEIAKKRGFLEKDWRQYLGHDTERQQSLW